MLEIITATLGISRETAIFALLVFAVIVIILLISRYKSSLMVSKVVAKSSNGKTWRRTPTNISPPSSTSSTRVSRATSINNLSHLSSTTSKPSATGLAQPTNVELPKVIIKQLQDVVANAANMRALFSKIDKLDTIVSDIGRLEALMTRIDGLEAIVARIEQLQLSFIPPSPAKDNSTSSQAAPLSIPIPPPHQPQAQQPLSKPVMPKTPPKALINQEMSIAEGNDLPEDLRYFFEELIKKSVWEERELRSAAIENGLRHNDAIHRLNDWAYEKYGGYLVVEDKGQFIVRKEIFA